MTASNRKGHSVLPDEAGDHSCVRHILKLIYVGVDRSEPFICLSEALHHQASSSRANCCAPSETGIPA